MITRNFARIAATLIFLAGWSQASQAAPILDTGASCFTQGNNDIRASCAAEARANFTRRPGNCGQTMRSTSGAAFLTAISVHQNICPKTTAFVPASYLLQQAPR